MLVVMAALPARKPATYADLASLPANVVGELVAGVLYASPRPAPRHANAAAGLEIEIGGPFHRGRGGPGGWWVLPEPEVHVGPDVVVPDLGGWRRERMPTLPEGAFFTLAPDWVCEVLSASTEAFDRGEKMSVYAREGVRHAWLVDPAERLLEAFVNEAGAWRPLGSWRGNASVRAAPFDALPFELGALWA